MSDLAQRLAGLSPAQRQLLEKRLVKARPAVPEPIAIVGMACRFPGAPDLDAYWRLIHEGRSAVCEVPSERWSANDFYDPTGETPGKMSVRRAALIDGPDQFDPQFFGITPREAARMDPQQRLLLEVAWEAMENAGIAPDALAGSRTGVFVGIGGTDYSKVCVPYDDYYQHIDAHMGTGNALSIAANRLSYIFDFHGPSAAVDTACSSSSLAIHFAVESLRRGESDAALAGGVNMILTPETTIAFSKARMLSPDGVCRPFDAAANGYVRGEGCGLVLLKRLAEAQRDGDTIFAVLRATSVNQDGRTSGISAPNSQSQMACIRAALQQAGLTPDDIDYIEAHGTGTPLGDPIEMQALSDIFKSNEAATHPCYVSSVKANVGHMETVSGVAGLIKVILMMRHEQLAPQAHFEQLNPHITLDGTRLAIPTEHVPWAPAKRPRIAGVSSFGFGGTNTHLIVEAGEPARAGEPPIADRPLHILKIAAKSEAALKQQAARLADHLERGPTATLADTCWSANTGRVDFNHRAAFNAKDTAQLTTRLRAFATGEAAASASGSAAGTKHAIVRTLARPAIAFLFTGQGSQYVGMGRTLYGTQPVFRHALDECDAILRDIWGGQSLLEIIFDAKTASDDPNAVLLHQTRYTQPALFALEYALAELWASWGVTPDIVLGHSVGEYAAACAAGVMPLEDGLRLIAERARLMQSVRRHGKMAVVFATYERVAQAIAQAGDQHGDVVIAVINGPENIVISGDATAVDAVAESLAADGIQVKPLNVSHAFHSPLMDEMLDEFDAFAAGIDLHPPRVPIAANLTGQLMTEAPTARYWRDHLRGCVQFAAGMERVAEMRPGMIIEIGPTASLLGMGRRCVPALDTAWLPSLREGQDDWQAITTSVSECYVRGGRIDWRGWDQPWPRRRVLLPTYPFQRSRHWYQFDPARRRLFAQNGETASGTGILADAKSFHPLLGARISTVWANTLFASRLSARSPAYLADHVVQGSPVMPAAAYLEQALAAAEQVFGPGKHGIDNLVLQQAMFLPEGSRKHMQLAVAPETGGESTFETYSRTVEDEQQVSTDGAWTMHAAGSLLHESRLDSADLPPQIDLTAARERTGSIMPREEFYALMTERGLNYGPAFQVLSELRRGEKEATARIELPEPVRREAAAYQLHPALGDALLQSVAGVVPLETDGSFSPFTYMPVGIRSVRMKAARIDYELPLFSYAVRTSGDSAPSPERVAANVYLLDEHGRVLVALEGVEVQRLGKTSAADKTTDTGRWLYRTTWRQQPLSGAPGQSSPALAGTWLVLADSQGVAESLAAHLAEHGANSILVRPGKTFEFRDASSTNGQAGRHRTAVIDPVDESHYRQLLDAAFTANSQICAGVVHLWALDETQAAAIQSSGCASALQLIRALARTPWTKSPPLWLVTAGAQAAVGGGSAPVAIAQATLLGFGRVAAMEMPDLRPRLVDLDPTQASSVSSEAASTLLREVIANSDENEVAHRAGKRYVARLVEEPALLDDSAAGEPGELMVPNTPFQLRITQPGSLDALRFVPVDREAPAAGQVEIEVRAAGLNFSDVLKALGLYPGIKDTIVPLGIEASGVVTAMGPGGDTTEGGRFRIGDEVFGVVPYAFASHARTAEYALMHKPKSIDHEEACTIPVTFLTAYYALVRLARLQPGERVLIHAGAGGVGLAAIQIARQIGAEIFATAGSDAKRDFLRSLGVQHVYSSRSTVFADEIMADTNREGVDVVLNSLPGEAITKSLSILRAYGRFLEIGKTDIYQNRMIGLLPFQDNLSYFAIDLDRMLRQRPDYIRELFAEVMQHFDAGHYRPLMFTSFAADSTVEAFRYMSQRKNIGKVVVSMHRGARSGEPSADGGQSQAARLIRRDGTYLISGGLGALGLRIARWLADQGAGAVALLARRGPSRDNEATLAGIRQCGTQLVLLQGDVADADSLAAALRQFPASAPPLRGVIHAAGVLADGLLADMTLEQFDRAFAPKVRGAWNLHAATLAAPLDFFVMFSSVASVLGSPGQANYAAGNAYLDALAHYRRAQNLPGTTINWGPWAEAGMAVQAGRDDAVKSRGMQLLPPDQALDLFGKLLRAHPTQVVVMDAQWSDMLKLLGSRRPALLTDIAARFEQSSGAKSDGRVDHSFRQELIAAEAETRHSRIAEYIRSELARIIGVEAGSLQTDQPLSTFGLDSLLALELKNNLESRLDFTLPMAKLMEGPTINSLAEETARLLVDGAVASASSDGATTTEPEAWTPLLALRATGSHPPLVLLPALGGDVRCYAELVQQLGDEQPVYAFRPRGVDQDLPPHQSMDEMIADYLAALRGIQPVGPYHLAGWSTGGIFGFALAEELQRLGEEVALLALFDTPLPDICDGIDTSDHAHFLCDLLTYANRFSGSDMRFTYERFSAQSSDEGFRTALAEARRQGVVPADTPEEFVRRLVAVGEANVRVLQGYEPRGVLAPVHLFVPAEKGGLAEVSGRTVPKDEDNGWSAAVNVPIQLSEVPGDHFTMMLGDGAAHIARTLSRQIGRPARRTQPV